jgi:hypothetical protein
MGDGVESVGGDRRRHDTATEGEGQDSIRRPAANDNRLDDRQQSTSDSTTNSNRRAAQTVPPSEGSVEGVGAWKWWVGWVVVEGATYLAPRVAVGGPTRAEPRSHSGRGRSDGQGRAECWRGGGE